MHRPPHPFTRLTTNPPHRAPRKNGRVVWLLLSALAMASPQARAQLAASMSDPQIQRQVAAIRAVKEARTPAQKKIQTQLFYAARQAATGFAVSGVPSLRPKVNLEADGQVKVKLKADVSPELLGFLKAQGGAVLASFPVYRAVYAKLPLSSLETVAGRSEVESIDTPPTATHQGPRPSHQKADAADAHPWFRGSPTLQAIASATAVNDPEGDAAHGAATVRAQYGVNGSGVKVGVISDSIDDNQGAYQAALNNSYIANLTILPGQAGTGEAEGLAMCEVVQRIVPGCSLYFATDSGGAGLSGAEETMAANIGTMVADGCQVIIDDVFYSDENPFQESGPVAQAVNAAANKGVMYFSCMANYGNQDSKTSSVWEGDYKTGSDGLLEFMTGSTDFSTQFNQVGTDQNVGSANVYLFWAEPDGNATSEYDLFEVDNGLDIIQEADGTGRTPMVHLDNVTVGDYIAVQMKSGSARFLHLDISTQHTNFQYSTAGRARGHNTASAANAFAIAATPANAASGGPTTTLFSSGDKVETFSNDGPRRIFFNPDGTAITSGNFSATGGRLLAKPDFTAADGVSTSLPLNMGLNPFFGTSCAAPHAGALAALLLSYRPTFTPAQAAAALRGGCVQIANPGAGNRDSGAGILLAPNIFQAVNTPPSILAISPANGPAGTLVTITGINLNTAVTVAFNGVPAPFTVVSSNALTATVPATATTGLVSILTAGGTAVSAGNFTLTASVSTPVISSPATASGQVDTAFTYQITATNNPTSFSADGLPAGLSVNPATGTISGVPTASGTFAVTVAAGNAAGGASTAVVTLTIAPALPAIASPGSLTAQIGVPFNYQIAASNSPTAYGASGLPPGLNVNPATGLITGTPTATGTFQVTFGASNAGGLTTAVVTLTVSAAPPVITSAPTASGLVGTPFAYQITATNNPAIFAASGLPAGLNLDAATGLISGTPTAAGTFAVGLSAGNAGGSGSSTLTLTVASPASVLPTVTVMATTPSAHVGSGAAGVITFSRSGGDLTKKLVVTYKLKGPAVNGKDYVTLTGTKKIKPNKASASIQIVPKGNLGGASSKKVKLVVVPGAAYTVNGPAKAQVKIVND